MGTAGGLVHVHKLAHVDPNCEIGEGTRVWQFASVIRGARIGANCTIGDCAVVDGARIGNYCAIGHGASINPGFECEDFVFIGPNVTMSNDRWPLISKVDYDFEWLKAGGVCVRVKGQASVGAAAVILPGVTIGRAAMVAASATVDRDVPAGYLFKRSGEIVIIDPARKPNRIREARA